MANSQRTDIVRSMDSAPATASNSDILSIAQSDISMSAIPQRSRILDRLSTELTNPRIVVLDSSPLANLSPADEYALIIVNTLRHTPTDFVKFCKLPNELQDIIWGYAMPRSTAGEFIYVLSSGQQSSMIQGKLWEASCQLVTIGQNTDANTDQVLGATLRGSHNPYNINALFSVCKRSNEMYIKSLPFVIPVWSFKEFSTDHHEYDVNRFARGTIYYNFRFGLDDAIGLSDSWHLFGFGRGANALPTPMYRTVNAKHWASNVVTISISEDDVCDMQGYHWRRLLGKMKSLKVIEVAYPDYLPSVQLMANWADFNRKVLEEAYGVTLVNVVKNLEWENRV